MATNTTCAREIDSNERSIIGAFRKRLENKAVKLGKCIQNKNQIYAENGTAQSAHSQLVQIHL